MTRDARGGVGKPHIRTGEALFGILMALFISINMLDSKNDFVKNEQ